MKHATRKLRPPIKTHGGKSYLARRIISLFPRHRLYCEPYLGGGSILLNKPPSLREVAGDLDAKLIEMWWSLQGTNAAPFLGALGELPYDEATFQTAKKWLDSSFGPQRAVGYVVRNRFSRGGMGNDFAWSDRLRGGQAGDVNAWQTILGELPAVVDRVKSVEFNCCDGTQLIRSCESPTTLIYADPPYLHETRTATKIYNHEMTYEDHEQLVKLLYTTPSIVFISGYKNDLYMDILKGWRLLTFSMPNHSGQGKTKERRTECVWTNT